MIRLKQFFTPAEYSNVLINHLEMTEPIKVIDLAMGECSLLIEAKKKWNKSEFYGNDIDKDCCKKIKEDSLDIKYFNKDIFKFNTIYDIVKKIGKVDLCIGNPPFYLIKQNKDTKKILSKFQLDYYYKTERIPAEVIFILQCLRILKDNGTLSLILPDGFFVNNHLSPFREFLINNYMIEKIIELPRNIFNKTDAKTHILLLRNYKPLSSGIKLMSLSNKNITILAKDAIKRMDYSYYVHVEKYESYKKISECDIKVIRGKSKCLIKEFNERHILHTTSFRNSHIFKSKLRTKNKFLKYPHKIAEPGDIILARVGSNSLGNIGLVESGYFLITDCIFIIRVKNEKLRYRVYNALLSSEGQKWIVANSKGVAARHITLEDIKNFPIL